MSDVNSFVCEGSLVIDALIQRKEDGEIKIIFFGVCTAVEDDGRKLKDRHSIIVKGSYLDEIKNNLDIVGRLKKGVRVRVEGIVHNRFRSPSISFPSSEIYAKSISFMDSTSEL